MTDTTNKGLALQAANATNWDVPNNANFGIIDNALGGMVTKSVTGITATPVVLAASEYQRLILKFTGTLTANVTYQIPSGVGGQWFVVNEASGSFTLTIANVAGGANVEVATGGRVSLYSDGTNIYLSDSSPATAGSTNEVIYNDGSGLVGSSNFIYDGTRLSVATVSAVTNDAIEIMRLNAQSSGTPANGIGPMIAFASETAPGVTKVGGQLIIKAVDVSTATEDFDLVVNLMKAGATAAEAFRVTSLGDTTITRDLGVARNVTVQGEVRSDSYVAADGTDTALINGITPISAAEVPALSTSITLLGTITTTSGSSQSLSGLDLTGVKFLRLVHVGVKGSATTKGFRVAGNTVFDSSDSSDTVRGAVTIDLTDGTLWANLATANSNGTSVSQPYAGGTSITTASTSVTVSVSLGNFTAGAVRVYAEK